MNYFMYGDMKINCAFWTCGKFSKSTLLEGSKLYTDILMFILWTNKKANEKILVPATVISRPYTQIIQRRIN